ncbi:MAG: hypothetical protein PSV35_08890, partial [bacterium]|nr:hypothetical protein [bacterium]
ANGLEDAVNKIGEISKHFNIRNVFFGGHGGLENFDIPYPTLSDDYENQKSQWIKLGGYLNQNGTNSTIVFWACLSGSQNVAHQISAMSSWANTIIVANKGFTPPNLFSGRAATTARPDVYYDQGKWGRPIVEGIGLWALAIPSQRKNLLKVATESGIPLVNPEINNVFQIPAITVNSEGSIGIIDKKEQQFFKSIREHATFNSTMKLGDVFKECINQ